MSEWMANFWTDSATFGLTMVIVPYAAIGWALIIIGTIKALKGGPFS